MILSKFMKSGMGIRIFVGISFSIVRFLLQRWSISLILVIRSVATSVVSYPHPLHLFINTIIIIYIILGFAIEDRVNFLSSWLSVAFNVTGFQGQKFSDNNMLENISGPCSA